MGLELGPLTFCLAACLGSDLGWAEKALALATASVAYSVRAAASLLSTPDCAACLGLGLGSGSVVRVRVSGQGQG